MKSILWITWLMLCVRGGMYIHGLRPQDGVKLEEVLVLGVMLCGSALFVLAGKTWQNHIYARRPQEG
jgi:hypothetical protein